ncbi:MAG: phosphoribosylformylglycinamidine synthase subunit PurS [Thermomicrobiales bacterium]|nr:phosphoribosylformylglycinamidine synthase subunit PurS [Thermomicrobiales bacterium]
MTITNSSKWLASVTVFPKTGVNDPEGEAILGGLGQLGYSEVSRVRAGRIFRVQLTADSAEAALTRANRMAEQLLSNPVIEQFSVEVEPISDQVK